MKLEIRWILWSNLKPLREKVIEQFIEIPNIQTLYFVVTSTGYHYLFSCESLICKQKLFTSYFVLSFMVWVWELFVVCVFFFASYP